MCFANIPFNAATGFGLVPAIIDHIAPRMIQAVFMWLSSFFIIALTLVYSEAAPNSIPPLCY